MSTTIQVSDTLIIELSPSNHHPDARLILRTTDNKAGNFVLTLDQARDLSDALPGAIGQLAALEADAKGSRS